MRRSAEFLSVDELKPLLSLNNLALAPDTFIRDVEVEEYQDWDGEESLKVYLILADDAPEDGRRLNETLQPTIEKIREIVREAGDPRFVYSRVGTRAEYDVRRSADPDEE